jgi:asparagine synthase (glutamine-hydrolysing)
MFAFAVWDGARERMILARDRLGIKPLYVRQDNDLLTFGSELGALRRHRHFEPTVDREALASYLMHGYVIGSRSIYSRTRRLAPGHILRWERGRVQTRAFWRLTDPPDAPRPSRFESVVDELEGLLRQAVGDRMIADVPLGAFLSGGVDSSAVVSLMQEVSNRPVRSFTIGFDDRAFNEAPFAKAVAAHLGTDHTELYVGRAEAAAVVRDIPALYDEPFADRSAIPTVLLSRLTRQHVTVALSGDGGDELFSGYTRYRTFEMARRLMALPRPIRRIAARRLRQLVPPRYAPLLRHVSQPSDARMAQSIVTHLDVSESESLVGERLRCMPFAQAYEASSATDPVRRMSQADAATYLTDDILTKLDRASMSVGLEARVPLLDHRVVRFAFSLTKDEVWRGGQTKAPLRALAYRRIPPALLDRAKAGFGFPLRDLMGPQLEAWERRYLEPARLAEDGLLSPTLTRHLLDSAPTPNARISRLWVFLGLQRWWAHHHRGEDLE